MDQFRWLILISPLDYTLGFDSDKNCTTRHLVYANPRRFIAIATGFRKWNANKSEVGNLLLSRFCASYVAIRPQRDCIRELRVTNINSARIIIRHRGGRSGYEWPQFQRMINWLPNKSLDNKPKSYGRFSVWKVKKYYLLLTLWPDSRAFIPLH